MTGTTSQGGEPPGNPPQTTHRASSCAKRRGHVRLCSKPRGARGIEPATFKRMGQLLSRPRVLGQTTGPVGRYPTLPVPRRYQGGTKAVPKRYQGAVGSARAQTLQWTGPPVPVRVGSQDMWPMPAWFYCTMLHVHSFLLVSGSLIPSCHMHCMHAIYMCVLSPTTDPILYGHWLCTHALHASRLPPVATFVWRHAGMTHALAPIQGLLSIGVVDDLLDRACQCAFQCACPFKQDLSFSIGSAEV